MNEGERHAFRRVAFLQRDFFSGPLGGRINPPIKARDLQSLAKTSVGLDHKFKRNHPNSPQ